ncbi:hypothetical protein SAMN04489707_102537 [Paenacidovorax caeni]|uniref:Uncharacterized protein n=1 Tax=Paenacidovorax caeni TaxID=343013 RepID=A0A1I7JEM0_9BURK|nr:hypothetical protein SAMN04489707_102537 [Paenacidovorax caeni]
MQMMSEPENRTLAVLLALACVPVAWLGAAAAVKGFVIPHGVAGTKETPLLQAPRPRVAATRQVAANEGVALDARMGTSHNPMIDGSE